MEREKGTYRFFGCYVYQGL